MANLKSLFGNLFKKAGGYTDDVTRLASKHGDDVRNLFEPIPFSLNDYSKSGVLNPYKQGVMSDVPLHTTNTPPTELNNFVSKVDEDWLTNDLLNRGALDSYSSYYNTVPPRTSHFEPFDAGWTFSDFTPEELAEYPSFFNHQDPYAYINRLTSDDLDATTLNELYKYLDVATPADASKTGYLNSVLYHRMGRESLDKALSPNTYDSYMSDQLSKLIRKINEIPIDNRSDSSLARLYRLDKF